MIKGSPWHQMFSQVLHLHLLVPVRRKQSPPENQNTGIIDFVFHFPCTYFILNMEIGA